MEQALCNLLHETRTTTAPPAADRLEARLEDGRLVLQVSDQGTGLVPGEEAKVFEKILPRYRRPGGRCGPGVVDRERPGQRAPRHGVGRHNPSSGVTFTLRLPVETTTVAAV